MAKGKQGSRKEHLHHWGFHHKTTTLCVCSPDQTEARRQATTQGSQHIAGKGGLPLKKKKKKNLVERGRQHVFSLI